MSDGLLKKIAVLPKTVNHLSVWDIDDTLFKSENIHVYVLNRTGIVKKLTTQEYNGYTLKPGERFDFSEFRNASKFFQGATPLRPNLYRAKQVLQSGDAMTVVLTARADFNNKKLFLKKFDLYGLDTKSRLFHVARSGNLGMSTAAGKKEVLTQCLNTQKFNQVSMFDDDVRNLEAFMSLASQFKGIKFMPYIVDNSGKIQSYR